MTQRDLLNARFGNPILNQAKFEAQNMVVWQCKKEFPTLPFAKMYVNSYILPFLRDTFKHLQDADLLQEIRTFDGCFNVRKVRGSATVMSTHSWGIAVDFNAKDNPLGHTREQAIAKGLNPFSPAFINIWRQMDWVCGADFNRKDLQHFQRTKEFS